MFGKGTGQIPVTIGRKVCLLSEEAGNSSIVGYIVKSGGEKRVLLNWRLWQVSSEPGTREVAGWLCVKTLSSRQVWLGVTTECIGEPRVRRRMKGWSVLASLGIVGLAIVSILRVQPLVEGTRTPAQVIEESKGEIQEETEAESSSTGSRVEWGDAAEETVPESSVNSETDEREKPEYVAENEQTQEVLESAVKSISDELVELTQPLVTAKPNVSADFFTVNTREIVSNEEPMIVFRNSTNNVSKVIFQVKHGDVIIFESGNVKFGGKAEWNAWEWAEDSHTVVEVALVRAGESIPFGSYSIEIVKE